MKVSEKDQQGDVGLYAVGLKFSDELKWIFRPQPHRDLGIDAVTEIVRDGESKGEFLALQVKSGTSWFAESTSTGIVFRFDPEHYSYWREYPIPVLIVLHSPQDNIAYWQVVNENTVQSTGKGWKVEIPRSNVVCKENGEVIAKYCDYVLPVSLFSITKSNDVSHGTAKRYSARLLLNRELSRGEIVQLIRRVTNDLRDREYYRDQITRNHWVGKQANVVWIFVYPSHEDEKNDNWICRSQWIDPLLDERSCPAQLDGTEIGEDLVIAWSEIYQDLTKYHIDTALSKEVYLTRVNKILMGIDQYAREAIRLFTQHELNKTAEDDYHQTMAGLQRIIRGLYRQGTETGPEPLECTDFGTKFQSVIAFADNITLPFSDRGKDTWSGGDRDYLIRDAINNYLEARAELQYEQKKLH